MSKETSKQFLQWLDNKLDDLGWSDYQLSLRAGLSSGYMSHVRSGKGPGYEACEKIAHALNVPVETVLRLAGHLPKSPEHDPSADELLQIYRDADDELKSMLLRMAREIYKTKRETKNGKSKAR